MNSRSLRFRLVVWYAAWLSVVFIAFGGIIYFASKQYLESSLKELLLRRARQVAEVLHRVEPGSNGTRLPVEIETRFAPEANGRFVRITRAAGTEVFRSGAPKDASFDPSSIPAARTIRGKESFVYEELPDGSMMILAVVPAKIGSDEYLVEVGTSAASIETTLEHVLIAFAISLPALILVAVAGGFVLVHRSLEPVDRVIKAAERISSRNLEERLPVPKTGDELERLSVALNSMIRRLDDAFQHNTRFMADTSHELRTPLTVIQTELEEVVRSNSGDAETQRLAGTMLDEVRRLTRIVGGLMAMSRLDRGEAPQEFVRFDLGKLVTSTADQMSLLAVDKRVTIRCTVSEPVFVVADQNGLRQITVNLLDNAIKYTPSGGIITVSVRAREGNAVLEVADNGIGIPADAMPHMFERFFRVDKARSRELGGAGLGLAIVKSICSAHGGSVRVESSEGKGSRFIVELPLVDGTPAVLAD